MAAQAYTLCPWLSSAPGHGGMIVADPYRVRLEAFEGPLDLLLHLIRRAEVAIADIPIALITEQYLEYLGAAEDVDMDVAGEFLVMAATLMEIKSRMLAPAAVRPGGERSVPDRGSPQDSSGGDPRAELIRQLLQYKSFRDAGEYLQARRERWEGRVPAAQAGWQRGEVRDALHEDEQACGGSGGSADSPAGEPWIDPGDLTLADLARVYARIAAVINFQELGGMTFAPSDTPIEVHARDLLATVRGAHVQGVQLRAILAGRTRGEVVGLFLALLELIRERRVQLRVEPDGSIMVFPGESEGWPGQRESASASDLVDDQTYAR